MDQFIKTSPQSLKNLQWTYSQVSKKLDTIEEKLPLLSNKNHPNFITKMASTYNSKLESFTSSCDTLVTDSINKLTSLEVELRRTFQKQCHYMVENALHEITEPYANEIKTLQSTIDIHQNKIDSLQKTIKTLTFTEQTTVPVQTKTPTSTSHQKSTYNFCPLSTHLYDDSPTLCHSYYDHNLHFTHEGDNIILQVKDFIKNSPQIQPPTNEDDAKPRYMSSHMLLGTYRQ